MSDFQEDEELEEKIKQDPRNFDEDELQEIQIYKSRKLKALRDSGDSGDEPGWWAEANAPETLDQMAGTVTGEGGGSESTEATDEEAEVEDEDTEEATDELEEEEEEEQAEETETEESTETESTEEPAEATDSGTDESESQPVASEPKSGVPQVGWSQGIPQTDEVEFSDEEIEGIYQRQDEIMENLQKLSSGMGQVDIGGEAIDEIQNTLDGLVDTVNELVDNKTDEELEDKVNELYDLLATARDAESVLSQLPPLPDDEKLVEKGIIDNSVEQDDSDECFKTSIDKRKASLHYGEHPDRITVFHYNLPTILSQPLRRTVEDILARALFEYAREEEKLVYPQNAPLRSGFLERHPDYYELTPEKIQRERLQAQA